MPQTSDNVIISGAGDSEVRIFDLQNMESPLFSMYVCHSDQVKTICVYDDNPNEFLTCSKDGKVKKKREGRTMNTHTILPSPY